MNNDTKHDNQTRPAKTNVDISECDIDEATMQRLMDECRDEKYQLKDFAPATNAAVFAIKHGISRGMAVSTQSDKYDLSKKDWNYCYGCRKRRSPDRRFLHP